MMNQEKIEMLKTYMVANIGPILIEELPYEIYKNALVIPSNCSVLLLNERFDGNEYVTPNWCSILKTKSNLESNVLIIDDISSIDKEEQMKFYELIKYRKVGTFSLPSNCVVIVTAKDINSNTINSKIYSLLVQI